MGRLQMLKIILWDFNIICTYTVTYPNNAKLRNSLIKLELTVIEENNIIIGYKHRQKFAQILIKNKDI